MVDINFKELINQQLNKADNYKKNKEHQKAANAYDIAGDLMLKWAQQAYNRDVEKERRENAVKLRKMAQQLRTGEYVEPQPKTKVQEGNNQGGKASETISELRNIVHGLIQHSNMTFDEIGGLDDTKKELKFTLGFSLAQPPDGVSFQPWTKILLYGPPGTGKTLLAAATSNALRIDESRGCVFFNVKVSSVLSKYFGESSKIISELYGVARDLTPAVVFLDEFESLCPSRDKSDTSGAERRILSTLLAELDGFEQKGSTGIYVLTIAATNRPWDLDDAVLSRFEKRILVPLPDEKARFEILKIMLSKKGFKINAPMEELVKLTEGLSGREIEQFCKQVIKNMLQQMNSNLPTLVEKGLSEAKGYQIRVRELQLEEFQKARKMVQAVTSPEEMRKYVQWASALEV